MIQRGCGSRFLLETPQAVRVGGHELGQDLDCDFAVQPGIARAIDLAHTARPQGRAPLANSCVCGTKAWTTYTIH